MILPWLPALVSSRVTVNVLVSELGWTSLRKDALVLMLRVGELSRGKGRGCQAHANKQHAYPDVHRYPLWALLLHENKLGERREPILITRVPYRVCLHGVFRAVEDEARLWILGGGFLKHGPLNLVERLGVRWGFCFARSGRFPPVPPTGLQPDRVLRCTPRYYTPRAAAARQSRYNR